MPPPRGTWNPIEGPGDYTTTKEVHSDTYPAIDPTRADLSGKAVFVTGASKGLGRAISLSFAKAGASYIAIGARSALEKVETEMKTVATDAGRREPHVLRLDLDVTDSQSVGNSAKKIEQAFGKLDVLINNAGLIGDREPITDSDPDSWWQVFNVNVRGPYLINRACLPLLLKGKLKTAVTISSVGAHVVGPGLSNYQTSKLAALRLTEFVAKEHAEQGVVAFSVHPGNMLTDMLGGGEGMDPKLKAVFTESPELCADSLVYLTRERRDWLSGRYINITWDLPELTSSAMREKILNEDLLKVKLAVPEQ